MPHFILDCTEKILENHSEERILEQVHKTANATGIFREKDIKVRLNVYRKFLAGGGKEDFIHVFAYIMSGRNTDQKAALSKAIVQKLSTMFPDIPRIAMNVAEFEKSTYFSRDMMEI